MKRLLQIIFIFEIVSTSIIFAQSKVEENIVDMGIIYKKIIDFKDTLAINILKIDLSKNLYELRSVKALNTLNRKETTSSMSRSLTDSGYNVIAAINADFFESDGELIDNMISEGKIVKATKFTDSPFNNFVNSQFAVTDKNKLLIEKFVFSGYLILPDGTVESINRINSKPDSNSISLYNTFQGDQKKVYPHNWKIFEAELNPLSKLGDTLIYKVSISQNDIKNLQGSKEHIILSANNRYAYYLEESIKNGDSIKVVLNFSPNIKNIRNLVGGWPRLVVDGKNILISNNKVEGVFPRFSEQKHPRTGIGFSKDSSTVYLITIDGRQETSSGVTLKEFADIMIQEGVYQGLNFDGGGSTTMVIKNVVVNHPSDETGEREVGNALVVIRKK